MKKVDLSKVEVTMLDGTKKEMNIALNLAQVIFNNTQSIEEHNFALELYKNNTVELSDKNRKIIETYLEKYFMAYIKIAMQKLLL